MSVRCKRRTCMSLPPRYCVVTLFRRAEGCQAGVGSLDFGLRSLVFVLGFIWTPSRKIKDLRPKTQDQRPKTQDQTPQTVFAFSISTKTLLRIFPDGDF